jgi:hypothetical protein
MAAAMARIDRFDTALCVEAARQRFSVERMTRDYISIYERLAAQSRVSREPERVAS